MIRLIKTETPEVMEIFSIIEKVKRTSSTNEKQAILKRNAKNEGLKSILDLTYNPHMKYKVTEKTLNGEIVECETYNNLMDLLHMLNGCNINDDLRNKTKKFLAETDASIRELYKGILLKDLKLGVNVSTINKVWKGLIPASETGIEVKPMLASKFDFEKAPRGEYAVTEKLDGIRCMAICTEDGVQLYSRQGKLIEGCVHVETDLTALRMQFGRDFVLDGELLAFGCDYETVYKETTKRVKNKNEIKIGIYFMVFDMLDIAEFNNLKCETPYYKRLETLLHLQNIMQLMTVKFIQPLYIGNDISRVLQLLEEYRLKGAEGLMVNLMDAPYEFKRSKAILKVKVMQTADLRIIGFEEGQGRNAGKLGALLVDFKGNTVGVGSGFTDHDREYIWNHQEQYLNKIAEIQFFEITKDKTGTESLRFPVWKFLREDKIEPSLF